MNENGKRPILPEPKHKKKRQRAIAYIAFNADDGPGTEYLSGIIAAVKSYNVNLYNATGNSKISQEELKKHWFDFFKIFNKHNVDGLIIWNSSFSRVIGIAEIESFFNSFNLPFIGLGAPFQNAPYILMDNQSGIDQIMQHFIEKHKFTKIGLVTNKKGHAPFDERFEAYLKALQKYNLPYRPELVVELADITAVEAEKAIHILLNERNLKPKADLEAIITVSDALGSEAIKTLIALDIKVPDEIAISGFNNSKRSRSVFPALTTIDPQFYNLGYKSVELLIAKLDGKQIPLENKLDCTLLARNSCGCMEEALLLINSNYKKTDTHNNLKTELYKEVKTILCYTPDTLDIKWHLRLIDKIFEDINSHTTHNFIAEIENNLVHFINYPDTIVSWQNIVSVTRKMILANVNDMKTIVLLEDIFHRARVLIYLFKESIPYKDVLDLIERLNVFASIGEIINSIPDLKSLLSAFFANISKLYIPRCYIVLSQNNKNYNTEMDMLYYDEGNIKEIKNKTYNPFFNLLTKEILHKENRINFILKPLYYKNRKLGFMMLPPGPIDGGLYENLRILLSSAIYGIISTQEHNKSEQERQVLKEKMELAARIQTALIPVTVSHEEMEISAVMKPAENVGGDFYDMVYDTNNCLWFAIGDVSGHGVTQGLITMMVQTSLHSYLIKLPGSSPLTIISLLNKVIYNNIKKMNEELFMSLILLKYLGQGKFVCTGTHDEIIIYRHQKQDFEVIYPQGMWLGVMPDCRKHNKNYRIRLNMNDILILHSDGIREARNEKDDMLGIDGLLEIILKNKDKKCDEIRDEIIKITLKWCNYQQYDDMSLIIIRRIA